MRFFCLKMNTEKKLLDLPTEVLMKIFSYVPNKVPLKFTGLDVYKIICKIEQNKFRLVIKDVQELKIVIKNYDRSFNNCLQFQENLHDHKIILRSSRVFDEILITRIWDFNEYTMVKLSEVIKKNEKTVRKVTISFAALAEHNLIKILNLLPELEEIVLDVSLWFVSCVPQNQLMKLTKVKSFISNIDSSVMILELPENILQKLSFNSATHIVAPSAALLKSIFQRQKNIKDLTLNPKNLNLESLSQLKLEKLFLHTSDHLVDIMKQQRHLTTLVVRGELKNQEISTFYEFSSQLISLDINVENISSALLRQLNCLQELKDLSLIVKRSSQVIDLTQVSLLKLKSFQLTNSLNCESFQILAEKMSKNFPALKHLTVSYVSCSTFSTLLENQGLVELNIVEIKPSEAETLKTRNEGIEDVSIGFANIIGGDVLNIISSSLPNLKKLRLNKFIISDVNVLLEIMKAFKQLTHLAVLGTNFSLVISNPAISTFLKIHKKNLENFEFTSNEREDNKGCQQKTDLDSKLQKMTNMFNSQFSSIFIDGSKFFMKCDSSSWKK